MKIVGGGSFSSFLPTTQATTILRLSQVVCYNCIPVLKLLFTHDSISRYSEPSGASLLNAFSLHYLGFPAYTHNGEY